MSGDSNQTLTEVYDSTNSLDSSGEGRRVPVRRSRWYPAVGQRSAVPDVSKIKSSIDNRNPQYKPTKRYRPTTTKTSNKVWRKKSKRGLNWIISRQVEIFQDHRYMAAIRKIRVRWEDLRVNNLFHLRHIQSRRPSLVRYAEDGILQSGEEEYYRVSSSDFQENIPQGNSNRFSGNPSKSLLNKWRYFVVKIYRGRKPFEAVRVLCLTLRKSWSESDQNNRVTGYSLLFLINKLLNGLWDSPRKIWRRGGFLFSDWETRQRRFWVRSDGCCVSSLQRGCSSQHRSVPLRLQSKKIKRKMVLKCIRR